MTEEDVECEDPPDSKMMIMIKAQEMLKKNPSVGKIEKKTDKN